ncbi:hypothetical protein TNCV_1568421 [Trichonephila clavipes]|nr:hypothetical protein TNCV_1568421 [Trichonephila clavipes]
MVKVTGTFVDLTCGGSLVVLDRTHDMSSSTAAAHRGQWSRIYVSQNRDKLLPAVIWMRGVKISVGAFFPCVHPSPSFTHPLAE